MKNILINATSYKNSPLLKNYLEMNGIKTAFVEKTGSKHYSVYEGADETSGFLAGEFSLRRDAIKFRDEIKELINK